MIACLLASFLLVGFSTVPMFLALASMGRVGVERDLAIFQSGDFYASLGSVMLGNHTAQTAIVIGVVPVIALLALSVCGRLLPKSDRRAWGCGMILCLVGLLLSVVGSVMNGFGYSTDRWALIFWFLRCVCGCADNPCPTALRQEGVGPLMLARGDVCSVGAFLRGKRGHSAVVCRCGYASRGV